jgi:Flp pilus assembly protein TadD
LAEAYLQRQDNLRARKCASTALRLAEDHPLANYVLARLYLSIGDAQQSLPFLQKGLSEASPHPAVLALLAGLRLRAGDLAEAERLYRLGARAFPLDQNWLKSLTRVYLQTGDQRKLRDSLEELAGRDIDNVLIRKKLVELCEAEGDDSAVQRWAKQGLEINIMDPDLHAAMGRALQRSDRLDQAVDHFRTALQIDPEHRSAQGMLDAIEHQQTEDPTEE